VKYIITGASSGLGFCLAERLLVRGKVVGISRTRGKSEKLCLSSEYLHLEFDFSRSIQSEEFQVLISNLQDFLGEEPFTIVLNAACFYAGEKRLSKAQLSSLFEVNLFSLIGLVQALESSKLRRVFFVNSISGMIGQGNQHEYSASKHAVMGFARSLAKKAKYSTYDVMCINPGGMKTELWDRYNDVNTSDFLNPSSVADLCISLIEFPQRVFIEHLSLLPPSDV